MHAAERQDLILQHLTDKGFVSFRDLECMELGSPATIRRDLAQLAREHKIVRLHGGARLMPERQSEDLRNVNFNLSGVPFRENIGRNSQYKEAIGRAAAQVCLPGEGIMIDGGTTTLQMCQHLAGLNLSVLTNSLHIVLTLIGQAGTRVLVPSGAVFPDQSIILSIFGEEGMPRFHAPKLFMGAAGIGPAGVMQDDPLLVAAERRLIERAEQIILLADASKFGTPSGNVVCGLEEVDLVITDDRIDAAACAMIRNAGVELRIVGRDADAGVPYQAKLVVAAE
jgi:DeoR family transcriptional regulator, ulaG and ulaABCDEF operon transcriptional repressor